MTIVLLIFQVIGILLLSLLSLLILLVLSLLFVPVRYKVSGKYGESMDGRIVVSWLFHLVSVKMKSSAMVLKLYVFGIPIRTLYGETVKTKSTEPSTKDEGKLEEHCKEATEQPLKTKDDKKVVTPPTTKAQSRKHKVKKGKKSKKKKGEKKKKKNSFSFQKISSIIDFVRQSSSKKVIRLLWTEVKRVIVHISPRKIKGNVVFGTGDPATTGMLVGVIGMFPIAYGKSVKIRPDFEGKVFEGEGWIKGRVYGVFFLQLAIRLYRNRQIMRFYNKLRKTTSNPKKKAS